MGSPRNDSEAARDVRISAALIAASLIGLLLALFVAVSSTSGDIRERAVYSVSITEFEDLPSYWNDKRAYNPVLGLTVHVKVPGGGGKADMCIGGHTVAAVVSYGGAFLAEGPVPRLCVKPLQEGTVAVAAWGWDAWVPRFLRKLFIEERERGEAAVDVAVPMRGGEVLVCKARIGGGMSPCTLEETYSSSLVSEGSVGPRRRRSWQAA